jgi:hypothetical protein
MAKDKLDPVGLLHQLEEPKFLRLFEYLSGGAGMATGSPYFPLDVELPNAELWHKLAGEVSSRGGWTASWFFQIAFLPPFLNQADVVKTHFRRSLQKCLRDIRKRPDIVDLLRAGSRESSPYFVDDGVRHRAFTQLPTQYYYISNVHHDYLPSQAAWTAASEAFAEELGFPCSHDGDPGFAVGTPKSMLEGEPQAVQDYMLELMNMPSSYYIVAREGEIRVVSTRHHGLYLAGPSSDAAIGDVEEGLAASITSCVPEPRSPSGVTVKEFETLIGARRTRERDIQAFLEAHPELLFGLDERYCEIRPHVCLMDANDTKLVPDFIARIEDSDIWHAIELKLPSHPILVDFKTQKRPSAAAAKGIAQLLGYADFFASRKNRERVRARYAMCPYEPALVVVIGRGHPRNTFEWGSVRKIFPRVRLVSYDYLLDRAKECWNTVRVLSSRGARA